MQGTEEKLSILLFAGTTEGRMLAEFLDKLGVKAYVSTATEYGTESIKEFESIIPISGRMDSETICEFIVTHHIQVVIDATHPFAKIATVHIKEACGQCKISYLRCLREKQPQVADDMGENEVVVASVGEAVEFLKTTKGNIFISTGSKELGQYTQIQHYKERCYARVLSTAEAVTESVQLGFQGAHLMAMQGPFSKELNVAMLRFCKADYFVTKESGGPGGFQEKKDAAQETGAALVVIGRPTETGYSIEEVKAYIRNILSEDEASKNRLA